MTAFIEKLARAVVEARPGLGTITAEKIVRAVLQAAREPQYELIRAMSESRADSDEGQFMPLMDLIDFSGENALHLVLRAAWTAAIDQALSETPIA